MDVKEFRRLGERRRKAEAEAASLTEQLRPLAAEALRAGIRPGEVTDITGWSKAQIRNIARAAGVDPARRGRAVRSAEPMADQP
jgi:hypothetical protein